MTKQVKTIIPTGIVRNTPDKNSKDGSLLEAIGVRYRDGAWRGVGEKVAGDYVETLIQHTETYHHPVLPADYYICYEPSTREIWLREANLSGGFSSNDVKLLTFASGEVLSGFAHLNKFLIVYSDIDTYTFYWKETAYLELGQLPIPIFQVTDSIADTIALTTEVDNNGSDIDDVNNCVASTLKDIDSYKLNNMFNGNVIVRLAWKLWDGSYIMHSVPYYWNCGFTPGAGPYVKVGASTTTIEDYYVSKLKLWFHFKPEQLTALLNFKEAGLIQSLCVFMSRPVSSFDITSDPEKWYITYLTKNYNISVNPSFYDLINEPVYKIHEFTYGDIVTTPIGSVCPDLTDIDSITTKEALPVDDFTNHKLVAENTLLYNSRLHLSNIMVKLADVGDNFFYTDWYDPTGYPTTDSYVPTVSTAVQTALLGGATHVPDVYATDHTIYAIAELDTTEGLKRVVTTVPKTRRVLHGTTYAYQEYSDGGNYRIYVNPFGGYQDFRCSKLSYYVDDSGTSEINLHKEFYMTGHAEHNLSVVQTYYTPVVTPGDSLVYLPTSIGISGGDDVSLPVADNYLTDTNRLQVSEQNNPLYYPAINSYRIGNPDDTIIACASVNDAMSEGQYGHFPLYIFNRSGMFTLAQGAGEVLYSSVNKLNNEVLTKKYSLLSVNMSIIFATAHGLRIISGRQVEELSIPVEGSVVNDLIYVPQFTSALTDTGLPLMLDKRTTSDFLNTVQDCVIGYDKENREIIVSKKETTWLPVLKTSYTFSLLTKTWAAREDIYTQTLLVDNKLMGVVRSNETKKTSKYGGLYNWYAIIDSRNIAASGWHVPSKAEQETLITYLSSDQSNKLKESGTTYWYAPSSGTNSTKFNARGAGWRSPVQFYDLKSRLFLGNSTEYLDPGLTYKSSILILNFYDPHTFGEVDRDTARSIRLLKDTTTLSDGEEGKYLGNDGTVYKTICIGTQEWLSVNLCETQYRNGETIPLVTDQTEWAALTTGAMCYYSNTASNGYTTYTAYRSTLYDLSEEAASATTKYLLLQTRPINLGTVAPKRIDRLVLRADYTNETDEYSIFQVYGSNDLTTWNIITYQQCIEGGDIYCTRLLGNYKYFVIVFAANKEDAIINQIDVMFADRFATLLK